MADAIIAPRRGAKIPNPRPQDDPEGASRPPRTRCPAVKKAA